MAKTVFRQNEIKTKEEKFQLKLLHDYAPVVEEVVEEEPEYTGPTADDLRREAEEYKKNFEIEKQGMLSKAQADADEIVKKAEEAAFAEVKRQTDQAQIIKTDAENAAAKIKKDAELEAQRIIEEAQAEKQRIVSDSQKEGYDTGFESGYQEGNKEAQRLVERMHTVLDAVMARREEILNETEYQIVELVVLIARKVVKIISENQRNVIMNNVLQALKKVKGRGDVTIRVNLADVKLTTEHVHDFIERVEAVKGITVVEDTTVEKGGCIVETDFGAIDARISSQLTELEQKIMEISPVKTVAKSDIPTT
ncbi:MAG: flagellar assembly protein FliH [Treponema sp.]|uniref:flagellar assembly protein FliH n=1 Tax=Treponema sp. TaxID=166 RepID=UPI001B749914|nr:flagellar assembly protein FliH [Treponema sp.]MBP5402379.1 flagellar assembly protein FliH [Treponema sp.]MBR5934176.1 flagellar assembly protein FliH [Treponema sp.]